MSTPGWALFVGIAMMLIGGCGAVNNVGLVTNPDKFEEISEELAKAQYELDSVIAAEQEGQDSLYVLDENYGVPMLDGIADMMNISDYRKDWILRLAKYGLFFSILYLLGGLMLLLKKRWSIPIVYTALFASVLFNVFQLYIYSQDPRQGTFESFSYIPLALNILVSVVALIVVATSDKTAYLPEAEQEY